MLQSIQTPEPRRKVNPARLREIEKLTPQQRIVGWRLALQPFVSHGELIAALWGGREDGGPENTQKIIHTTVYHIRQRFGVPVQNYPRFGYVVRDVHRRRLLDALAAEIAANVEVQS